MKKGIAISRLLSEGIASLKEHRCAPGDARRDAELLLTKATDLGREAFLIHPETPVGAARVRAFRNLVRRRLNHEPMAYLLGTAWFRGREFLVNRDTLIPRWATESLVLAAITALEKKLSASIVDVGTGSGAIAVTLAVELPQARILATDTSAKALAVARLNARRQGVSKRIVFQKIDLVPVRGSATAIIANLPYLPTASLPKLSPDIRLHEPRIALDGDRGGLGPYRRLAEKISRWPHPPSHLFLEILPGQYRALASLIKKYLPSATCEKITNPSSVCIGLKAQISDGTR